VARKDLGTPPADFADDVNLGFLISTLASQRITLTPARDFTISLPDPPATGDLMVLYEIYPSADVVVMLPSSVILTSGLSDSYDVQTGKACFVGLSYSPLSGWTLLAATTQV
jgi:hypothetical protein